MCIWILWGESDKFYMFDGIVDNFVDNLWITPDTKTYQKLNRYNYIDKSISNRQKEKKKTPEEIFRGFGGIGAAFVVAVAVVVTLRVL